MKISKIENRITKFKKSFIVLSAILVLLACNRNDPVGSDFIGGRAGEVICDTLVNFAHLHFRENSITGSSDFLYAGENVVSLLSFERPMTKVEYDSVILEFKVKEKKDEDVYLRGFSGEFDEDSLLKWGYVDLHLGDIISESVVWLEDTISADTILRISAAKTLEDSIINIAVCGEEEGCALYSRNSKYTPLIKLFRGPLLETVEPFRDAFVDTLLDYDTTDIFVASGSFELKDSVFLRDTIIDFDELASVNDANLYLPVIGSYGTHPEVSVRYDDGQSAAYKIEGDTIKIEVTKFIDQWIDNEDRFLIIEGRDGTHFRASFSKDIMLEVLYTKKPGEIK